MPPGVRILEVDNATNLPAVSNAICGIISPSTKGAVDVLNTFTDESAFINSRGRPIDNQYGVRAGVRFLRRGNQLKHVRVAGNLLATAKIASKKIVGLETIDLLTFFANSPGTWANNDIQISITTNGLPAVSYNVLVYFRGTLVENYPALFNAIVENTINNNSRYITVTLHPDAGINLPDETIDITTEQIIPLKLVGGNDGAFASSSSENSTTGGISAQNIWQYTMSANTTVNFTNTENRVLAPGTLKIIATVPAETFTDNGLGELVGSATGTGRVDYRTGKWSVAFFAIPTSTISITYKAGTQEQIVSSDADIDSYSGTISREGVAPSFISIYDSREDRVEIGNGATASYTVDLGADIVPGSVVITTTDTLGAVLTITDDSAGAFTGDVTGPNSINYKTGVTTWTFTANVENLASIIAKFYCLVKDNGSGVLTGNQVTGTINYQTGAWTLVHTFVPVGNYLPNLEEGGAVLAAFRHTTIIAFGDGVETEFEGTLKEIPVKKGSVSVVFSVGAPLTDDSNGNLTGIGGSGTINYLTGAIAITLTGAAASGFPIQVFSDAIIIHSTSIFMGDIGNQKTILTNGLFVWIDKSAQTPITLPPSAQWYRVRIMFNSGTGAVAVENFDGIRTVDAVIEILNNLTTGSKFVSLAKTGNMGEINVAYDTNLGQKIGMAGAFTQADVIGTKVGNIATGLQLFADSENVGLHFLTAPGMWHRQVQLKGIELSKNRRVIWVFSLPKLVNPQQVTDFVNGNFNSLVIGGQAIPTAEIPYPPLAAIDSDAATNAWTWLTYFDQYSNKEVTEPPEAEILALAGNTSIRYSPVQPFAGLRRGEIVNIVSTLYSPTTEERVLLQDFNGNIRGVINPIVRFTGLGIFLFGSRTMSRTVKATDQISCRWTANLIGNALAIKGLTYNFELNDEILWREITDGVNSILQPVASARGIYDYRIVCDSTTNTEEVIAARKCICKIFIRFTDITEEIEFQLVFASGNSAEFSEVAPIG